MVFQANPFFMASMPSTCHNSILDTPVVEARTLEFLVRYVLLLATPVVVQSIGFAIGFRLALPTGLLTVVPIDWLLSLRRN